MYLNLPDKFDQQIEMYALSSPAIQIVNKIDKETKLEALPVSVKKSIAKIRHIARKEKLLIREHLHNKQLLKNIYDEESEIIYAKTIRDLKLLYTKNENLWKKVKSRKPSNSGDDTLKKSSLRKEFIKRQQCNKQFQEIQEIFKKMREEYLNVDA